MTAGLRILSQEEVSPERSKHEWPKKRVGNRGNDWMTLVKVWILDILTILNDLFLLIKTCEYHLQDPIPLFLSFAKGSYCP